jgi:polar amino acid transport system substrate-binding protein
MKRRNSLLVLAASSLAAASILVGQSVTTSWLPDAAQAQKKTLTMGTSPDYPPYEFYDTSSGNQEIVGFDVDIAKAITGKLGYELKISGMDFDGLIPALLSKRVDFVMAGMTPTEERKKNADFSDIYFEAKNTIVAKKGSNFKSFEELAGKKLGVQLGSIQEGEAKGVLEDGKVKFEIVSLNKIGDLILEIKAGRIDAAIIEDTVAKGFVEPNPDLEFAVIPTDGPTGSAIAFPKDSPLTEEFNRVLTQMIADGEIEKLAEKWFSESIAQQ